MSTTDGKHVVVVGAGNPLMGDDGLGLCALEQLTRNWTFDDSTELVDGGTWGLSLLPMIEGATDLLFLDAIRTNSPPGTLIELRGEEIPKMISTKLSPHEIDLREVLAIMQLRGTLPREISAIGVEPEYVDLRDELSPTVRSRVDAMVALAVARLESWGVRCEHVAAPEVACTR